MEWPLGQIVGWPFYKDNVRELQVSWLEIFLTLEVNILNSLLYFNLGGTPTDLPSLRILLNKIIIDSDLRGKYIYILLTY